MNANIAEYHVPVNADVHEIDVIFVDEPDDIVNPLGIKGLGEIGIVGVATAIANAVYTRPEGACATCQLLSTS
jgi:xanthine dehydrogenase YagR molybdenum-binding subunit